MNGQKRLQRLQALSGLERGWFLQLDVQLRAGVRDCDRQRDELRCELYVSDGQPGIAAPDVDHWSAAAIVGSIHSHVVALLEARIERPYPVAPVLEGGAFV